jgi:hypothetical protein
MLFLFFNGVFATTPTFDQRVLGAHVDTLLKGGDNPINQSTNKGQFDKLVALFEKCTAKKWQQAKDAGIVSYPAIQSAVEAIKQLALEKCHQDAIACISMINGIFLTEDLNPYIGSFIAFHTSWINPGILKKQIIKSLFSRTSGGGLTAEQMQKIMMPLVIRDKLEGKIEVAIKSDLASWEAAVRRESTAALLAIPCNGPPDLAPISGARYYNIPSVLCCFLNAVYLSMLIYLATPDTIIQPLNCNGVWNGIQQTNGTCDLANTTHYFNMTQSTNGTQMLICTLDSVVSARAKIGLASGVLTFIFNLICSPLRDFSANQQSDKQHLADYEQTKEWFVAQGEQSKSVALCLVDLNKKLTNSIAKETIRLGSLIRVLLENSAGSVAMPGMVPSSGGGLSTVLDFKFEDDAFVLLKEEDGSLKFIEHLSSKLT